MYDPVTIKALTGLIPLTFVALLLSIYIWMFRTRIAAPMRDQPASRMPKIGVPTAHPLPHRT